MILLIFIIILLVNWWYVDIVYGVLLSLLLVILVTLFSLFFLTTNPDDLSLALVKLRVPYKLSLELSMAIRFIPTLTREVQIVVDAQRARGLDIDSGFVKRLRNLVPIFIPIIVGAVRRSYRVAEAMESRAFGASKRRSYLFDIKFKTLDYLVMMFSITFTFICLILLL